MFDFFFKKKENHIDNLARSMLGAFLIIDQQDYIGKSLCYDQYNGDTLPPTSGYNDYNRLLSYMSCGSEFKSKIMNDKLKAIEMYIENNILSDKTKMYEFLERYLNKIRN